MIITADYHHRMIDRLKKDLQAAKNFYKLCRQSIREATKEKDEETVYFWANQQDNALQQIQAIEIQLNAQ